jgi:hypothetical protein
MDNLEPVPGELVTARRLHAATALHDGRVLLWGGRSLYGDALPAELYDPASQTFAGAGWSTSGKSQPPSQLTPNGELFASGATIDPQEGIDPSTEALSTFEAPATLLPDGSALHVEGTTAYVGLPEPQVEVSESGPLGMPRRGDHAGTLLRSGRVLLTGGRYLDERGDEHDQLESVELDTVTNTFVVTAPLARPRVDHTATLLGDGRVLIVGGRNLAGGDNRVAEVYDPATQTMVDGDATQVDREGHTATVLPDGDVLIVGGSDETLVERFVEATGKLVKAGDLATPRRGHTATLLSDGRVLVAGGGTAQLELYDPAGGSFSSAGTMLRKRTNHGAALLPDGRVLLTGGDEMTTIPAEAWDPATGGVQEVAVSGQVLYQYGLKDPMVLWSGDVLFYSGALYRHLTGDFAPAWPPSAFRRERPSLTRLLDGTFLAAGFFSGAPEDVSDSVSTYGPVRGFPSRAPRILSYPASAELGTSVAIGGARLTSETEGTSGHTLASAVDHPVAVWVPATEGTPSAGALVEFDRVSGLWQVPSTSFAGFGFLLIATAGSRSVGVPLVLSRAALGASCALGVECGSGVCTDGVCCDRACGPCEACTAAAKGGGDDGSCGPLPAGQAPTVASACPAEPISTCGRTGVCDGAGDCAAFDEGTPCLDGASCREGACTVDPLVCEGSLIKQGAETFRDCSPYACNGEPACLEACDSALDCAPDKVCTPSGACDAPPSQPARPEAGCDVGGRAGSRAGWGPILCLLAGALAMVARRRRAGVVALTALGIASGCSSPRIDDPPQPEGGSAGQSMGGQRSRRGWQRLRRSTPRVRQWGARSGRELRRRRRRRSDLRRAGDERGAAPVHLRVHPRRDELLRLRQWLRRSGRGVRRGQPARRGLPGLRGSGVARAPPRHVRGVHPAGGLRPRGARLQRRLHPRSERLRLLLRRTHLGS